MNPSVSSSRCEGLSPADNHMDDWHMVSSESALPQVLEVSRDEQEAEDRGKLRSKLVSAWNSVKYGQFPALPSILPLFIHLSHCYELRTP